ncbi:HNH endonuclease [Pyxidicoccus fallax]|uniref:HNH endonuclease n=1 Tax=Pyxidicoccus fallax TaxID=394095 RepID=A0A848LKH2_9BACT|nr:HNH endonuclease [Pyxidicoccus fallax]NMO18219.1 HNH endonuclease [Pyxidicoccus fallax]NPC80155.1 HNH endonuclease [Pyxidicoccus fallax]
MRKLDREPLSPEAMQFLAGRTQKVLAAPDRSEEARRLWDQKGRAFDEIRATLELMSSGHERCMYCEDSAGTDIEHFWPKATYPDKAFTWANYLLACSTCNSNHKREQFPLDAAGAPLLVDPTVEEPRDHLSLSGRTGKLVHRTPKGEKSIEVFGLARHILEKGRRDAWGALQSFLVAYDHACSHQDWMRAREVQRIICGHPFASVFGWFMDAARSPAAAMLINKHCLAVLEKYPDIQHWL